MSFILLIKYWKELLLSCIIAILLYLNTVQKLEVLDYKNRYDFVVEDKEDYIEEQTRAYNNLQIVNKDLTIKYQQSVIRANEYAKEKLLLARNDAADVTLISNGLFQQISDSNTQLSSYSTPTVINYATTYSELFKECTVELGTMAERATGHAIDVETLNKAWPIQENNNSNNTY